ncbi:MAG: pyruvate-formate lyase, partial [Symbiobacteriaceae bacterium]|nr:pyruvate-formate lyase [Symbiobacteriaceae bacterium]
LAPGYLPVTDPSCGLVTGIEAVTKTFVAYLDHHPIFFHPDNAFAGCWIGNIPGIGDPWRPEHRNYEHEQMLPIYNITTRGIYAMNHCAPDLRIGLELGWGGLLAKIHRFRELNNPKDPSFYEGHARLIEGVQRFIARHVAALREAAASAEASQAPELARLYTDLAECNAHLIAGAPRTMREVLQWLVYWQDIDRMYFNGGAGQELDTLLQPYYEADLASGALSGDEEAIWLIASLFFNDPHYHMIGGQDPLTGEDVTSPLSFLILEAQHRLNIPNNLSIRVHEKSNEELFTRAVQYLFADGSGVCYSLSHGLDRGYMRNGRPLPLARMRAKVGCNWTALPGIEYCLQDVTRICLAQPLLLALEDMLSGSEPFAMELLLQLYEGHLAKAVQLIKDGFDWHYTYKWQNKPEVVLNIVSHGAIERGLDISHGGVDIINFACDAIALATTANSLAAIEQRVVREKRLSWERLGELLRTNYADAERERLMLKSIPQYGAGGTLADSYALYLAELYTALMRDTPTSLGFIVLPGIFSHGQVYAHGKNLGATPNGRWKGAEISHSADPDPGFLPGGNTAPTAKANAVASVQSNWGNSTPLQLDIDAGLAQESGGVELIKALIRTHNHMGGTLININVISKETILAAHANPDAFPDLVVRVTGYSAFFKSLSPEYRQQVVDRWLGTS